jgi:hypothetical protein
MHPIIRLACLLLWIINLRIATITTLIILLPIFFWLFTRHTTFTTAYPLLKRLRWLILSLLILQLWFHSPEFSWLPNLQKIPSATQNIGSLILMVLAAHLLLKTTPIPQIIAALQWWLSPLTLFGYSSTTLAVRITLILETVETVQQYYQTPPTQSSNPLSKITKQATTLLLQVHHQAETTPLRTLAIPQITSPPFWQWGYPLLLLIASINHYIIY